MKRLFRTSKPTIDPLPPPPPAPGQLNDPLSPTGGGQFDPAHVRKPASGQRLDADKSSHGHAHNESGKSWFGLSSSNVTPFPSDVGHSHSPMRRLSRKGKKEKGAPSMLEISQMQQPPTEAPSRNMPVLAAGAPPGARYDPELTSPDSSWTVVTHPPPKQSSTDSPEKYGSRTSTPPLPIPSAPAIHGGSGRSSPNAHHLYLPPGARPPTPPTGLRASTPTRPPFQPGSLGQSQSSIHSHQPYPDPQPGEIFKHRSDRGRDRGYSSASGSHRGSDVESSIGHSVPPPLAGSKPGKLSISAATRSPLVNAYAGATPVSPGSEPPSFPSPHPHQYAGEYMPNAYSPMEEISQPIMSHQRPYDDQLATQPQGQQQYQQGPYPVDTNQNLPRDSREKGKDKDKDKKKFWGMDMGWAGRKDKDKDKDKREKENLAVTPGDNNNQERSRKSFDWSSVPAQDPRYGDNVYGQDYGQYQGRGSYSSGPGPGMNMGSPIMMEDEQRGRLAGKMFFKPESQDPTQAKDVNTAIQLLCQNPDPSLNAIYAVCERINQSDSLDDVCKQAARAIRKQFKHGNEAERRAASVVWLLMMRNIQQGFRVHGSSKNFMASLEPILLAPQNKPVVGAQTHHLMLDVLGDLAFEFGRDKGCEGLLALWRKVKGSGDPDSGRPLPSDHPIFVPEAQFPTHFHDPNGYNGDVPPPLPMHARPANGPGYANLPSHSEDMRRLMEESTAAKETARVLSEALVYAKPEDVQHSELINEFYTKCFHAHESLTNQMDWAQAEAARSRERSGVLSLEPRPDREGATLEEQALAVLLEAHAALSEAIRQHDEMGRMAMEAKEFSEVRERSKKDIRMGRDDPSRYDHPNTAAPNGLLGAASGQASGSRSASPTPSSRRPSDLPLPPFAAHHAPSRSRTPSPDAAHLLPPNTLGSSPARPASPLGRVRGSRPLPDPLKGNRGSNASLSSSYAGHTSTAGFQVSNPDPGPGAGRSKGTDSAGHGDDDEEYVPRVKPSNRAMGKRKAKAVDPDNDFNPDDMFIEKKSESSSEESVTADDVFFAKPVTYAYDAYQEKLQRESASAGASASASAAASTANLARGLQGVSIGGGGGSGTSGIGGGSGSAAPAAGLVPAVGEGPQGGVLQARA